MQLCCFAVRGSCVGDAPCLPRSRATKDDREGSGVSSLHHAWCTYYTLRDGSVPDTNSKQVKPAEAMKVSKVHLRGVSALGYPGTRTEYKHIPSSTEHSVGSFYLWRLRNSRQM